MSNRALSHGDQITGGVYLGNEGRFYELDKDFNESHILRLREQKSFMLLMCHQSEAVLSVFTHTLEGTCFISTPGLVSSFFQIFVDAVMSAL